jgi:predicted nucleotidyltransferase
MSARRITIEDVRARRQDILRIVRAKGAENPRVFGSVARGTADEKSDVDFVIDVREPRPRGFHYVGLIVDLEEELARLLGYPVHVTELWDPSPDFAARVFWDAVAL